MMLKSAAADSEQNRGEKIKQSFIIKIASFLNYLSKKNYEKLVRHIKKHPQAGPAEIFKILQHGNYLPPRDLINLKKVCLSFAKIQDDFRFGRLCIDFNFLTRNNLALALEEQARLAKNGTSIRLGDLLINAGMLSERQRDFILYKQKLESLGRKKNQNSQTSASESSAFDTTGMKELRENGMIILIENSALKAFILKTPGFNTDMTAADIKLILEKNKIIYGVKDDHRLAEFITDDAHKETPFEVAVGQDAVHGIDARIKYRFEQNYLKAGSAEEDGTFDFKNRGDLPFVKQGDLLAEKIALKEGRNGVNIFGDTIFKHEAKDIHFNLGKGACYAEDKSMVIADVDGTPKISRTGEISVNDVHFIEGNVDYNTGHVKFDKNVFINGSIRSGFKVDAIDVVANTIEGGIINARGDVLIKNGVTESNITAQGSIIAGFMHRTEASCMGDIHIAREIADTSVNTEGRFEMPGGRMFSSDLNARGGAKIRDIGSERAKPSTIGVGTSGYTQKTIADADRKIEACQNSFENKTAEKKKIDAKLYELFEQIADHDQRRKKTLAIMEQMGKNRPEALKNQMQLFQKNLDDTQDAIDTLKKQEADLKKRRQELVNAVNYYAGTVKSRLKEKFDLQRMNRETPARPVVEVLGRVTAGTRINGIHSNMILRRSLTRCRFSEVTAAESTSSKRYDMVVSNL